MFRFAFTLFCTLFVLGFFTPAAHANAAPDAILKAIYAPRNNVPYWTSRSRFTIHARNFVTLAEQLSRQNGLNPDIYGLKQMRALLDNPPENLQDWQYAEILWSYNAWLLASDLAATPLNADEMHSLLRGNIAKNLQALPPKTQLYKAMQQELALLEKTPPAAPLDFGIRVFRPGMKSSSVLPLRAQMLESGYMLSPPKTDDETEYDPALVEAVKAFQAAHALAADGDIGASTLAALNTSNELKRIRLFANMERLREQNQQKRESKRIEVSIAQFELTAYEAGKPVFSMPVIVGSPRRQTIAFRTEISGVRLNPTWHVPKTIKNEDYIPLLLSQPERLQQRYGVQVIENGERIDPVNVDWNAKTRAELSALKMFHPAGRGNPLGRYRVLMENRHDIYLHDTNAPNLFQKNVRALSSGCIRVEEPELLTRYILKEKSGWSAEKTQKLLATGKTVDVIIENKIPIYLDYLTVWFNHRRQLVVGSDIYGLDKPRYDGQINKVLITEGWRKKKLNQVDLLLYSATAR